MKKIIFLCLFIYISVFNSFCCISQNNTTFDVSNIRIEYSCDSDSNNILSLDNPLEKVNEWQSFYKEKYTNYFTSHLALKTCESFKLKIIVPKKINNNNLNFYIENTDNKLSKNKLNDSTIILNIQHKPIDFKISSYFKNTKISQLNIHFFNENKQTIFIVPLTSVKLNKDSITNNLNSVYKQVNIQFDVKFNPVFYSKAFNESSLFVNPDINNDQYTHQMRDLRDIYFDRNPNANKNAYYIFIIPGFINNDLHGYMARNKAFGFVSEKSKLIYKDIVRTLGFGLGSLQNSWVNKGPQKGSTENLMDINYGSKLTYFQWELIRSSCDSYLYYDAEEDVKSINGRVAYYSWQEDLEGNIIMQQDDLLTTIKRPFKKNYLSYHLNIKDILLKPLFSIGKYFICWFHFIFFSILLIITLLIRKRWKRKIQILFKRPKLITKFLFLCLIILNIIIYYAGFIFIQNQIIKHKITSGYLEDLKDNSYEQAIQAILENKEIKRDDETDLISEILLKRDHKWYMRTKGNVLYFSLKKDENNKWNKCKFQYDSKFLSLSTQKFSEEVESHYMVFNYFSEKNEILYQRVFNHNGTDITNKITINEDPSKRVLLFVNGYRPTSIGRNFEESFSDIQKNGFEFPNSNNLIYLFDRYDYWRPWNEIDLIFQRRINPTESYYADGHFSVETSNYKSLIEFTSTSSIYPERCSNKFNHTCKTVKKKNSFFSWFKSNKTLDLLPTQPNKHGFNIRRENGRIAGKNLLQMLNEIPNKSKNDTINIIAHSMGYAYALGIIDELKGNINLGEFYIISPENPESGEININDWTQVYQYGCDHNKYKYTAPCMLDGIAPQKRTNGLPVNNHIFIPEKYYNRHGFYDSHFIGYFTWIFDLKPTDPGYIRQR